MLNDLRQILEEDNRIESDLELMMEAVTDSEMMDAFIDEDGEAEIPESELTKILSKIPEYNRDEELNKKLKRLTESVIPDYDFMTDEEFCEAMDIECEEYLNTLEEQDEYDEDDDDHDSSLNESMTIIEQASSIVDDILEENKLVNAVNNFNAKHNKGKYGKIREKVTKKISKCKSEDKLTALEKDLQMGIVQLNEMISKVEKPEEKKEIKDHIKWCKGEAKRLIKARRKEIRNK